MKARSLGIPVEDYITDKVVNVDIFERAQETYENIDPDLIDKIYSSPEAWTQIRWISSLSSTRTNALS